MKRPLADAATSLSRSLHPFNLLLCLSEVGYSFEDVWPGIEETWIEAVRARHWDQYSRPDNSSKISTLAAGESDNLCRDLGVSDEAAVLVEKLKRKSAWGANRMTPEAMQKLTHLDSAKLQGAIHELVGIGLLQPARLGAYSLDPGRQYEVDRIAELLEERPAKR